MLPGLSCDKNPYSHQIHEADDSIFFCELEKKKKKPYGSLSMAAFHSTPLRQMQTIIWLCTFLQWATAAQLRCLLRVRKGRVVWIKTGQDLMSRSEGEEKIPRMQRVTFKYNESIV